MKKPILLIFCIVLLQSVQGNAEKKKNLRSPASEDTTMEQPLAAPSYYQFKPQTIDLHPELFIPEGSNFHIDDANMFNQFCKVLFERDLRGNYRFRLQGKMAVKELDDYVQYDITTERLPLRGDRLVKDNETRDGAIQRTFPLNKSDRSIRRLYVRAILNADLLFTTALGAKIEISRGANGQKFDDMVPQAVLTCSKPIVLH